MFIDVHLRNYLLRCSKNMALFSLISLLFSCSILYSFCQACRYVCPYCHSRQCAKARLAPSRCNLRASDVQSARCEQTIDPSGDSGGISAICAKGEDLLTSVAKNEEKREVQYPEEKRETDETVK